MAERNTECKKGDMKTRNSEYKKKGDMKTRNSEYKKKGDKKTKSWSDLPEELIVSIMECLYVADRIRFRAVCKNWSVKSARVVVKTIDKLPWTMVYKWRNPKSWSNPRSFCKLYEPRRHNRKLSYVVEIGRINGRRNFVSAEVYASRDGWVLLYESYKRKLFFFNPFTKEVIYLPPMSSSEVALATFSSAPVSLNCFVFIPSYRVGKFHAELYSHADKAWKTYNLITDIDHRVGVLNAVCYMKGTFYCHFDSFHLAAFDMMAGQEQQPSIVMTTHPPLDTDSWSWEYIWPRYLLECDGDFFLVNISSSHRKLCVLKLDWERKEWVRVSSLEGRAMFLGHASYCVSAGGETETIANRIYYYNGGVPSFLTLDGYEHDYPNPDPDPDPDADSSTLHKDKNRQVEKAKIYGCCRKSQKITWIQPPKDF